VDDSPDTLRITARLLRSMGLRVTTAQDNREAIDLTSLCLRVRYSIDLILLNVQTRQSDGIETVGALRSMGFTAPLVAISDDPTDALVQQCKDAGCDDFIAHPLDFHPIYDSLVQHLPRQSNA
jgi:CheY-like chemotaxis protein